MEAWTGFGPVNEGFADPCLTTWLPRLDVMPFTIHSLSCFANSTTLIFCFFRLFMHFFLFTYSFSTFFLYIIKTTSTEIRKAQKQYERNHSNPDDNSPLYLRTLRRIP